MTASGRRVIFAAVLVVGSLFVIHAGPWISRGFGYSLDGFNGAVWGQGARAAVEHPIGSRLGGIQPDGHRYADHPPLTVWSSSILDRGERRQPHRRAAAGRAGQPVGPGRAGPPAGRRRSGPGGGGGRGRHRRDLLDVPHLRGHARHPRRLAALRPAGPGRGPAGLAGSTGAGVDDRGGGHAGLPVRLAGRPADRDRGRHQPARRPAHRGPAPGRDDPGRGRQRGVDRLGAREPPPAPRPGEPTAPGRAAPRCRG